MDYLVEEVLQLQPEPVRNFLLETCILDRLCAPLCDAVTEADSAKAVLETLERSNLFLIPLDDNRQWYRYHHLFADVLRAHLREEMPHRVPKLYGRASQWYEQNGYRAEAIRSAVTVGDFDRAAGLIELEAEPLVRAHHPDRLVEWLKPIPDAVIQSMPVLSTYYGHALQGVGDLEGSASRLADAERIILEGAPHPVVFDQPSFERLPALVAVARGYLAIAARDPELTAEYATRALALLSDDQTHWRGTAIALLGLAHWFRGDLEPAQRFHRQAVANFETAGDTGLAITSAYHDAELLKARGHLNEAERRLSSSLRFVAHQGGEIRGGANLHLGLSELRCERNDLEGAARELALAEQAGIYPPRTPFRFRLAQARLVQCRGALEAAAALLIQAAQLQVRGAVPDYRPVAAWLARIRAVQGRFGEARDWVRERGLSTDDELNYGQEYEHITLAKVLIAAHVIGEADERSLHQVDRLLERLLEAAEAGSRTAVVIEILLLQAIVDRALANIPDALAHLERALTLAESEGYVRLFVDEGEPVRDLLRLAVARGIGGSYSRRLLSAFEKKGDPISTPGGGSVAGLSEPLTAREVEILRLVAAGMRNQEIADHLVTVSYTHLTLPTNREV